MARKNLALMFLFVFIVYLISGTGETPFNYFSRLAFAFTKFNFYIEGSASHLSELIPIGNNRFFVPYAPGPAFLMLPFALIFGEGSPQTFVSAIFASGISIFSLLNAYKITSNKRASIFVWALSALGTNLWFMGSVGSSWYFGQITAAFFLSLAIFLKLNAKNNILIGLALGMAYLARPHTLLSLPFFIFLNKFSRKGFVKILLGLTPALIFNAFYNYARFGVLWDAGYSLIPGVLDEPWYTKGIFHISYIERHIKLFFAGLPAYTEKFPFFIPKWEGMAIWLTTPAFILILKADFKDRLAKLAVLSIALIAVPIFMHGTTGFIQFGYRFAVDFYAFLFLLIALYLKKYNITKIARILLFLSILVNFWGVVMINKLAQVL